MYKVPDGIGRTMYVRWLFIDPASLNIVLLYNEIGCVILIFNVTMSELESRLSRPFSSMSSWAQSNSERSEEQTERSDVWDLRRKSSTPLCSAQDDG